MSLATELGRMWKQKAMAETWIASTARVQTRTAANLPQTYSPGLKGVEWSRSPSRHSSSWMMVMPATMARKNA